MRQSMRVAKTCDIYVNDLRVSPRVPLTATRRRQHAQSLEMVSGTGALAGRRPAATEEINVVAEGLRPAAEIDRVCRCCGKSKAMEAEGVRVCRPSKTEVITGGL